MTYGLVLRHYLEDSEPKRISYPESTAYLYLVVMDIHGLRLWNFCALRVDDRIHALEQALLIWANDFIDIFFT